MDALRFFLAFIMFSSSVSFAGNALIDQLDQFQMRVSFHATQIGWKMGVMSRLLNPIEEHLTTARQLIETKGASPNDRTLIFELVQQQDRLHQFHLRLLERLNALGTVDEIPSEPGILDQRLDEIKALDLDSTELYLHAEKLKDAVEKTAALFIAASRLIEPFRQAIDRLATSGKISADEQKKAHDQLNLVVEAYKDFRPLPAQESRKKVDELAAEIKLLQKIQPQNELEIVNLRNQIQADSRELTLHLMNFKSYLQMHPDIVYKQTAFIGGSTFKFLVRSLIGGTAMFVSTQVANQFFDFFDAWWVNLLGSTGALIVGSALGNYRLLQGLAITAAQKQLHKLRGAACMRALTGALTRDTMENALVLKKNE